MGGEKAYGRILAQQGRDDGGRETACIDAKIKDSKHSSQHLFLQFEQGSQAQIDKHVGLPHHHHSDVGVSVYLALDELVSYK